MSKEWKHRRLKLLLDKTKTRSQQIGFFLFIIFCSLTYWIIDGLPEWFNGAVCKTVVRGFESHTRLNFGLFFCIYIKRKNMKNWKPVDVIVLLLAFVVGFVLIYSALKTSTTRLSPESIKFIAGLLASMLTIVSIYVGGKIRKK